METQDVIWSDKKVGEISVEKIGLYHLIKCRCQLPYGPIYRLSAIADNKAVDLGILVPQNGLFQLMKRLPVKSLGEDRHSFYITDGSAKREGDFVPIDPNKPFANLAEISNSRFTVRNGTAGVSLLRL